MLQPTKISLHPLNLSISNFLDQIIIKYAKNAGFWAVGSIFRPKN